MQFRNLIAFRIQALAGDLAEALARRAFAPCSANEMTSSGFVPPRGDANGAFVECIQGYKLLALQIESRVMPASTINVAVAERAAEIAEQQGHAVGRKQRRELKELVIEELMPRALTKRSVTLAMIVGDWLLVDAATDAKAEELLETLRKSVTDLSLKRVETQRPAGSAMTDWVASGEAPAEFTIDQDLELRAPDEGKATVRYVRHDLQGKEIQEHIAAGKTATRLGMTWNDRISFVLNEELQLKRIAFLDIIKEEAESRLGDNERAELFDIDLAICGGELSRLVEALVDALGGLVDRAKV